MRIKELWNAFILGMKIHFGLLVSEERCPECGLLRVPTAKEQVSPTKKEENK